MVQFPVGVKDLPSPPPGRTGFPWTEGTKPLPKMLAGGKNYPKISVVTPSYQQGEYLEETIRSVLLQGYPNLEYLVIDGGSRDNTIQILEKYAPFLDFWVSEQDKGQTNAINKGFGLSSGEIMGWLNSDDMLLPNALYWIARTFVEQSSVNFVTGFRKIIDKNSRVTSNFVCDVPTNYYLSHYCCVAQETTYWRRSVWDKLGRLDETLHFALDYEYWLRAIQSGESFHLIPHYIGGFRSYPENKTNSWLDTYHRDMNVLYRRYKMGSDEADVHAKLGRRWAMRYPFYLWISERAWTNSPRLVQLTWLVLEKPILCDMIVGAWRLSRTYQAYRERARKSKYETFRFIAARAVNRLVPKRMSRLPKAVFTWENIRAIPIYETDGTASLTSLPDDSLALGKNWYPIEYYDNDYFRWSGGSAKIHVINPTGKRKKFTLLLAPGIPGNTHTIDLLDGEGTLILSTTAATPRIEIEVALPETTGTCVTYELRWRGPTLGENSREKRRLAFRILGMVWNNSEIPESALRSFQYAVDFLLAKRATDNVPMIGNFVTGLRRLRHVQQVMTEEVTLWRQFTTNLATLGEELRLQESNTRDADTDDNPTDFKL